MLFSRFVFKSKWVNFGRQFCSESAEKVKPETGFQRAVRLVRTNKQAIINTMGVYFVLSYSVHNYRVQQAWDERELEFKGLEEEVDRIKTTLENKEWITATETKVKRSTNSVLSEEIQKVLSIRDERAKVVEKQGNQNSNDGGLTELTLSLIDGGKDKGKKASSNIKIV